MSYELTVAIILVAGPLAFLVIFGYWLGKRRDLCYSCYTVGLKEVNSITSCHPSPRFYSLHRCETCGAAYRHENGEWIYLSPEEWSKEPFVQPPPVWRAATRVRCGPGEIELRRSEDNRFLQIKQVKALGERWVTVYWSAAVSGESAIPTCGRLTGMISGKNAFGFQISAGDGEGFFTLWSEARHTPLISFAIGDLP